MANFQEECYRISRIVDPTGTDDRDWEKNEGQALRMVLKEVKKLFQDQVDLQIDFSDHDKMEPVLLIYPASRRSNPIVAFKFRAAGSKVSIWPVSAPGSSFKVADNPSPIQVDGGWDADALSPYFAEVLSRLG